MKTIKLLALLLISSITFMSCSDDDDSSNPEAIVEEEVITTMNITLTSEDGSDVVTLTTQDLDGEDGPLAPEITGGTLAANTTYNATVELLNELENPAEDITLEVAEENDVHQFFFEQNDISTTFSYSDVDENEYPVGLSFSIATGAAGSGTITVTLKHEPNKSAEGVSNGDITNAGGSTDVEATFPITIQ